MATVTIIHGVYRNQTIQNQSFEVLKGFTRTPTSNHITVSAMKQLGRPSARIKVDGPEDFVMHGADANTFEPEFNAESVQVEVEPEIIETDEEVLARIDERFEILNQLTMGAKNGDIRALMVCGAPGVGKTFGVEKTLQEAGLVEVFTGELPQYEIVSGRMSPIGLYMKLYSLREEGQVLVVDDCDEIFNDELGLNLLKSALDTSKRRVIHWNVDSLTLRKGDVPNSFEYKGSVIFISNRNFKKIRSEKIRAHMIALQSRAFYLDLTVHTDREKLLRIEDLVNNHDMLGEFNLSKGLSEKVMQFVRDNATRFNELSLRTAVKLGGLAKTFEKNDRWMKVAEMSLMGHQF